MCTTAWWPPQLERTRTRSRRTRNTFTPSTLGGSRISPGTLSAEQVLFGQSLVSHEAIKRTEYYDGLGSPYGLTRSLIGGIETPSERISSIITINRSDTAEEFDAESGRLLAALVPHLRRALALHRRLVAVDVERSALVDVLDRFREAVLLVTADLQVVLMNRAASRLANRRDGLTIDGRCVRGATPAATASLTRALVAGGSVAQGERLQAARVHVQLPRPSGQPPLDAAVFPLVHRPVGPSPGPTAALFLTDPDEALQLPVDVLAGRYQLTPAEARVAAALAQGHRVKDIADALHLTQQTTRWYVKRVLAKTGVSTQAQVVRLLLSITAAMVDADGAGAARVEGRQR